MSQPKIFVNVDVSDAEKQRIEREEQFWTGPKLIGLTFATLAVALVLLFVMAESTSETYWPDWLTPGGVDSELER